MVCFSGGSYGWQEARVINFMSIRHDRYWRVCNLGWLADAYSLSPGTLPVFTYFWPPKMTQLINAIHRTVLTRVYTGAHVRLVFHLCKTGV